MSVVMRKLKWWGLGLLPCLAAGLLLAPSPAWAADSTRKPTVQVSESGALGQYLTDGGGRTLYFFAADSRGVSKCYEFCANTFPAYTIDGTPVAGEGVVASRLGTLKRKDGETQVTYAGHPLYLFQGDMKPGSTAANDTKKYGGTWAALAPDGDAAGAAAAKPETDAEGDAESAGTQTTTQAGADGGNPFAGDQEAAAAGKEIYSKFGCYGCHGRGGGGGMGPSLIDKQSRYGADDDAQFKSIAQGRPQGMPGFGSKLSDKQVWQVVTFLNSISNASQGKK